MPFVPDPPSTFTGETARYLRVLATAIRAVPNFSSNSLLTPESVVTGVYGDFFINRGSASTMSRLWFKTGPDDGTASTVSWKKISLS